MIEFNITGETGILLLTFVVGTVLPLLVGIISTKVTSAVRKAVLLLVLTFVTSVVSEILTALVTVEPYDVVAGLFKFGGIFVIGIATYFGIWSRPTSSGTSLTTTLTENVGRTAA